MKKAAILLLLCSVVAAFLSGCNKDGDDKTTELYKLSDYSIEYNNQVNKVKGNTYKNLNIDKCQFYDFPKTDIVCNYETDKKVNDKTIEEGIKQVRDVFENYDIKDFNLNTVLRDSSRFIKIDGVDEYPLVYEHLNDSIIENGNSLFYETPELHIQTINGNIYSFSDGVINKYRGGDSIASFDALGKFPEEENFIGRVSMNSDKKYDTLSGMKSVEEQKQVVEKFLSNRDLLGLNDDISTEAFEVSVYKIKDKYCYKFNVRRLVNNVPVFWLKPCTVNSWNTTDYIPGGDGITLYSMTDKINSFVTMGLYDEYKQVGDSYDSIIGIEDALEKMENFLGKEIMFDIESAEFVYEKLNMTDNANASKLVPSWQFVGVNTIDNKQMIMFVNAIDGNVDYIVL